MRRSCPRWAASARWSVPRSSYSPGVYQSGSMWDTGDVDHDAALHATIPGPWGPFHVAATERGVVAVGWLTTDEDFEADVARRTSGHVETVSADDLMATRAPIDDDPRRTHLATAIAA